MRIRGEIVVIRGEIMVKEELLAKNDIKKFITQRTHTVFHEVPEVLAKVQFAFFVCQRRNTFEGKIDALQILACLSESLRDMADKIFEEASALHNEWHDVGFEHEDEDDED